MMHILGYLVLLLALGGLLNKYVVARLARLEESTQKLAAGYYSARVDTMGKDEIGDLAECINRMGAEIQKREQTLRENEERFRLTTNSIKDALILLDCSGHIIFWNKIGGDHFGYTADEVMGRILHEFLVPPRYRDKMAEGLKDFCLSGPGDFLGSGVELSALRKDGKNLPLSLRCLP